MTTPVDPTRLRTQLGAVLELRAATFDDAGSVVLVPGGPHAGRLAACTELARSPGTPRADPFSLVVTLEGGDAPQGTYVVTGAGLDSEAIFFVPIGPDEHGHVQLEAIFN